MKHFVINLPDAVERRNSISKQLDELNIEFTLIVPEQKVEITKSCSGWTEGANSLRLTTIKIIELAIEKGYEQIHIWEDDSIIDPVLYKMFEKEKINIPFHFIHLNYNYGKRFSITHSGMLRRTIDGVMCCQSYIVHNSIYNEYLTLLREKLVPIDVITKFLHTKHKQSYVVDPAPVMHISNKFSYIRNQIVNY